MKTAAIFTLFLVTFCSLAAAADGDLESALNKKYNDQILILRRPVHSDLVQFNSAGELVTLAAAASWTVDAAIEIHKLHLTSDKLTLQGDRFLYGFELSGKQLRPYKLKDKTRSTATVEIALSTPLSSMDQADAVIHRVFASNEADLISSAPEVWRPFLEKQYDKPELADRSQAVADSESEDEKPFKPSKEEARKMKPPKPVYTPEPNYSAAARSLNVRGTLVLSIIIDKTGAVRHPKIIRPLGLGLDEQALNTARTWRFEPATFNGEPVTVQMGIEINFDLQ